MVLLKQSTSVDVPIGPFLDETDGKTAETALTITQPDIRLKKNNGNWAQKNAAQTLTHEENGWYELTLDTTDTGTLGVLVVAIHESGALPVWREFHVVPANVYDSLVGGSDTLQVDVTQFGGTNGTFASGRPEVNASHWAGAATATDDIALKASLAKGTDITGFNDLSAAQVNAEVDTALADIRLDELLAADSDIDGAAPPTVGSVFHELMTKTAGSFTYDQTTDSLEAVRDNMGTPQTGDSFARLGAPAGASVSADIAAIEAQTDDIGVAGAGLTAVPWNAAWDAEVQSEVQDAIEANHLDHLLAVTYDPASKPGAADALLNELVESDAGVSRYTANALEQAPTGGSAPTAADIADAVWEEAIADHSGTAGSTAEALGAAGSAGDPWTTALPGAYGAGSAGKIIGDNINATISSRATQTSVDTIDDFVDTEVAAIKAKTDQLTFTVANRVDSTTQAGVSTLDAAGVRSAVGLSSANLDTQLTAIDDFLDTEVAAIKAKTDNLPTDPADQSAVEAAIDAAEAAILAAIPSAATNASTLLDVTDGIETSITPRQAIRLILAASAGKLSGAATSTVVIRNVGDTKDRITATVDADGNRAAVTTDVT